MTNTEEISNKESKATWDLLVEVKRIVDTGLLKLADDVDQLKNSETKNYYRNKERDRQIKGIQKEVRHFRREVDNKFKAIQQQIQSQTPKAISEQVSKLTIVRDFVAKKEFIYIMGVLMLFFGMAVLMLESMNQSNGGFVVKAIKHFWK